MSNAKKPSNRVDPKVRKARKEKLALKHLGGLGFILWGYFGFGVMLLGLAVYSLFQIEKQGLTPPVLCFCFSLFFMHRKNIIRQAIQDWL